MAPSAALRLFLLPFAAAASIALPGAGCSLVPPVSGGPAAVAPAGKTRTTAALGAVHHVSATPQPGTFPNLHIRAARGVGARTEVQYGVNGAVPFVIARHQLTGDPADGAPGSRASASPADVGIEAGGHFSILPAYGGAHIGTTVSVPLGGFTPYATYRYHVGAGGEDHARGFAAQMAFLGVEADTAEGRRWGAELAFGAPAPMSPVDDEVGLGLVGFNVTYGW